MQRTLRKDQAMCLLVSQPEGVTLPYDLFLDAYKHNNDGLGIAIPTGTEVKIVRALPDSAITAYRIYLRHAAGKKCAIHLRMATHGTVNMSNCHPFHIHGGLYLMHNGVLKIDTKSNPKRSDTWHFSKELRLAVEEFGAELMLSEEYRAKLGKIIGYGNRLAFITKDDVFLVNEDDGMEAFGCWLSNEYAWTPELHGYESSYGYGRWNYSGYSKAWDNWEDEDEPWEKDTDGRFRRYPRNHDEYIFGTPANSSAAQKIDTTVAAGLSTASKWSDPLTVKLDHAGKPVDSSDDPLSFTFDGIYEDMVGAWLDGELHEYMRQHVGNVFLAMSIVRNTEMVTEARNYAANREQYMRDAEAELIGQFEMDNWLDNRRAA